MEILVDYYKLKDSSVDDIDNANYLDEPDSNINQFMQDLIYATPACYLISGYRGAGKSSFINKLDGIIKQTNSKMCFVKVNIPKYEGYNILLRKLIRSIYISIVDKKMNLNKEVKEFLETLYLKTFNQVQETKKISTKREIASTTTIEFDILNFFKKLFSSSIVGLGLLIVYKLFDFVFEFNSAVQNVIIIFVSIFVLIIGSIKTFNLKKENKYSDTDSNDIETKTMYDDEIADLRLQELLNMLQQEQDLKLVFVFDELDKLTPEKADSLISEIKPLLLSGNATYILVTGQDLYYNYQSSQYKDDSILSSIISKTLHISLLSTFELAEIFNSIFKNKNTLNSSLVLKYLDSIILRSNRIPRRFIKLIKQDIIWKNDESFLIIDARKQGYFETDSKLLDILLEVENNYISPQEFSDGLKDFFVIQLHLWIQKMMTFGKTPFTVDNIYNYERDYKQENVQIFKINLDMLILILLGLMVRVRLLSCSPVAIENKEINQYVWIEEVEVKSDSSIETEINPVNHSLTNSMEINYLQQVLTQILSNEYGGGSNFTIKEAIIFLLEERVLERTPNIMKLTSEEFWDSQNSQESSNKNKFLTPVIAVEVITSFVGYIAKKYLSEHYDVVSNISNTGFDIIAQSNSKDKLNLLIEVKNYTKLNRRNISEFYDQAKKQLTLHNNNSRFNEEFKVLIFIFVKNDLNSKQKLISHFKQLVDKDSLGDTFELFIDFFEPQQVNEWFENFTHRNN
ncbi:P-loop NTPase fold protein [Paenibacillus sp. NPDC057934]|uniref:P-loop NTPase fold protein n=1 Tax=Paenibacillus sp. NPDC057934 TaxID=3346282 RepID=UPI0036DC63D0